MKLTVSFGQPKLGVKLGVAAVVATTGTPIAREYVNAETYTGSYTVTPSAETQTISTEGYRMGHDIVVNPIPSNYGLITWDGHTINVS